MTSVDGQTKDIVELPIRLESISKRFLLKGYFLAIEALETSKLNHRESNLKNVS